MDDAIASLVGATVRLEGRAVLADVTLSIAGGERVAVVGPNGAGKSTLLRALAGDVPTAGAARLHGEDPARADVAWLTRRRAFLEQSPECAWDFTAREVVALGSGDAPAREAIESLGLGALAGRGIRALSGGEQRLVHLARCLAQLGDPAGKLLLLDEPTSSLDPGRSAAILEITASVARAGGGVILATHDLGLAAACDRVAVLAEGRLRALGAPGETLVPEVTRAAWGVAVRVSRGADGRVTVTTGP